MRMESEFYISEQNVYLYSKIAGDIVSFVQYGTSKELNEINEGYPVLRLNEFESVFISKPAKYCNLLDRRKKSYYKYSFKLEEIKLNKKKGVFTSDEATAEKDFQTKLMSQVKNSELK